jgi:1,4-alpha-glucan branching enzyme
MAKNSLVLHINMHQDYFSLSDECADTRFNQLFNAITYSYMPLLNMFANLEADGIPFAINMTISPSICSMLSDPVIQQMYIEWLDKLIILGEAEVKRASEKPTKKLLAQKYLQYLKYTRRDFTETLNQNILSKFAYYAKKGNIELLATCATNCYLPHYADMTEALNAQIEAGLNSHKYYFETVPEGFWLPFMGYAPGVERAVRSYGLHYTVLDSHALLFGNPIPKAGIFNPVRCYNSLAIFARDNSIDEEFTGPDGYLSSTIYRNQNRDIGYESDLKLLNKVLNNDKARFETGFKYFPKDEEDFYDSELAEKQAKKDALDFLNKKSEKLAKASSFLDDKETSIVCVFDDDFFGGKWYEGIIWLEELIRLANNREDIKITHFEDLAENQFSFEKITPFLSSSEGSGYGENLLDSTNGWMLRYARKATERMINLASRFTDDTGLKARSLNLGAKEVLLAMSADKAKMMHDKIMPDCAATQFIKYVSSFSNVFDSLGSNCVSTEWLTTLEREHSIFPWINYHIFSPKK